MEKYYKSGKSNLRKIAFKFLLYKLDKLDIALKAVRNFTEKLATIIRCSFSLSLSKALSIYFISISFFVYDLF